MLDNLTENESVFLKSLAFLVFILMDTKYKDYMLRINGEIADLIYREFEIERDRYISLLPAKDKPNAGKVAGIFCYLINKYKPVVVYTNNYDDREFPQDYNHLKSLDINEEIALMLAFDIIRKECNNKVFRSEFQNDIRINLRNNFNSPQSLAMLFEAICGEAFFPPETKTSTLEEQPT